MIRETRDFDLIARVFSRPEVEKYRPTDAFEPVIPENAVYYEAMKDGRTVGVIYFDELDGDLEGHFMVLPEGAGLAAMYARQALRDVTRKTGKKVVGFTPRDNTKALRAAFAAGMKYVAMTDEWHMTEYRDG